MTRFLSLGAGVQSSTLALMMAKGEIEPCEHAIFADTGGEPKKVYDWLDWLEKQLPFPVHRVNNGKLFDSIMRQVTGEGRFASVPWRQWPDGLGRQQCTSDYKIIPIRRKQREIVGPKGQAQVCIGISLDEAHRMKPSPNKWQHHVWPLIDARMTRGDCYYWLWKNEFPMPPKSACIWCPYHSDVAWQEIKDGPAEEWETVVRIDKAIRVVPGMRAQQFMHRSFKPIDQVEFTNKSQVDMFGNDCSGVCGV